LDATEDVAEAVADPALLVRDVADTWRALNWEERDDA
jgi:hypothetical protein